MRITRIEAIDSDLLDGASTAWAPVRSKTIEMLPSPIGMVEEVSPFMALSEGHGAVTSARIQIAVTQSTLSVRLSWVDPEEDAAPDDLDQFADGAAVMFPLVEGASALTMGAEGEPVNAWLWKADEPEPFDMVAEGYSTSARRAASVSGLKSKAVYSRGRWSLVFQRPLQADGAFVSFDPGKTIGIAVAIWEGSNHERAGQKSVSGEFSPLEGLI